MNKYIVYGLLALILVVDFAGLIGFGNDRLGAEGDTNLTNLVLSGDLTVGDDTTITGDVSITGTLTLGGSTAVDGILTATATYNPGSLTQNATTTTQVVFDSTTGIPSLGSPCSVGLTTASTSLAFMMTAYIDANDGTTASSTVVIHNLDTTIDYATGTLRVTCIDY